MSEESSLGQFGQGLVVDCTSFAEIVGGTVVHQAPSGSVTLSPGIVTVHSDLVQPGGIFFALQARRDGHLWVNSAIENGAAVVVVSADVATPSNVGVVKVASTLDALQALARWYLNKLEVSVIAVVGSVGKTSTKDALVHFLNETSRCFGSPASYNSQIGVPLSVLECDPSADYGVFEVGASEPGELERLLDLLEPDALAVTQVGQLYRENFPGDTGFGDEVCAVIDRLENQTIVIAAESLNCSKRSQTTEGSVKVERSSYTKRRTGRDSFEVIQDPANNSVVSVATSASWIADNVGLAASMAKRLGHTPASQQYRPTSMDLQIWRSPSSTLVMRAACVDEPMAWRTACNDAIDATSQRGSVVYVLGDEANAMSPTTLQSLYQTSLDRQCTVLTKTGPASKALQAINDTSFVVRRYDTTEDLGSLLAELAGPDDVVVLFVGRDKLIDGAVKDALSAMAPSKLYIDVQAVGSNIQAIRRHVGPVEIMAVVKASAYGADAPELARHLLSFGVESFAVSQVEEGLALRKAGIDTEILVLLPTVDELSKAADVQIAVCVHSTHLVEPVIENADKGLTVHVEVDTGMHRTGVGADEVVDVFTKLVNAGVKIDGLMSHLASADEPRLDNFTRKQIQRFETVVEQLRDRALPIPRRHIGASSGLIRFPEAAYEMVRPGLAVLGIHPSDACAELPLNPVLTLVSQLVGVHDIQPGDAVGYGSEFVASKPMRVGVVQLGYHDGILRSFVSGGGTVVVHGVTCRLVGRLSMDSLVADITDVPTAGPGSEVLVFGQRNESTQRIEDVAEAMDTIPYAVIAGLGSRIQRISVKH